MRLFVIALVLSSFFIAGCAPQNQPRIVYLTNEYKYSEEKKMLERGPNTIKGSALWRQSGGGVVTCAGNEVGLTPKTAYSTERILARYGNDTSGISPVGNNIQFSPESMEYQKHVILSQCDAQGYFTFENVADGEFFVTTQIIWAAGPHNPQGGAIMKSVSVNGGEVKTVILAP